MDSNVVEQTGKLKTRRLKDFLMCMTIIGSLSASTDKRYKGKVRELLLPFLEDISMFNMNTLVDELTKYEEANCLFEQKSNATPTANFGAAGEEKKPVKANKPAPDQAKILKLKSKMKSFCVSKEAWEKHCNDFMNLTYHTNGRRVCYYCIEAACLDRRTSLWRESPEAKERGTVKDDYKTNRHKMDMYTKEKCPAYQGGSDKAKNGVQVYASRVIKTTKNQSPVEKDKITLHCAISCASFTEEPCKNPKQCAKQRQEGAQYQIKKAIGIHNCGYKVSVTYIEEHRLNKHLDQDLERLGFTGESSIIVAEFQDYVTFKAKTAKVDHIKLESLVGKRKRWNPH